MSCGNIAGVINQQAPAVISHDVAGKAEGGLLGALNMILQAQQATKDGEDKQRQKGEYLSTTGYCDLRPGYDDADEDNRKRQQNQHDRCRHSDLPVVLSLISPFENF